MWACLTVCMWRYQPNYFVCDGKSSLSSVPNPYKIDVIQTFENATIISPSNEENIQNYTHNRRTWKCNGERKSIYKAENNNKKKREKTKENAGEYWKLRIARFCEMFCWYIIKHVVNSISLSSSMPHWHISVSRDALKLKKTNQQRHRQQAAHTPM